MARLRTIQDVQKALANHFINAWEAVRYDNPPKAPVGYVLGNEKPEFDVGDTVWARFSMQYVSNRNLFLGDASDTRQRTGLIRVEIHMPEGIDYGIIADLENAVIEAYEGTPPDNIRFSNPFPTREGVIDADFQTTINVEFRLIA